MKRTNLASVCVRTPEQETRSLCVSAERHGFLATLLTASRCQTWHRRHLPRLLHRRSRHGYAGSQQDKAHRRPRN